MLEFMNASRLVEALGLALLHSLWQCLLIGILFKALLSAMRRSSPGMRYWASVGALALLAASLPLTTMYLLAGMQSLPASTLANAAAGAPADSVLVESGSVPASTPIVEWTVALWVAGVAVVATRTLMSWRRLSGLRRTADFRAASGLVPIVDHLRGVFGLSGKIAIGFSASIASPMIIGWLKPVILLPPAVAARLPHEQLEMIIAHELAHLRRQDHWVNLFQVATETLMFYHPVVAMVSRRIRIERENACDDLAVAATERRLDYVEMLAALERQRGPGPALALGVHDGQVVARIRRLVEGSEPGNSRGAAIPALIALAAVAGLATAPLIDRAEVDRQAPVAAPIAPPSPAAETESRRPARPNPSTSAGDRIASQAPPRVQTDPNRAPTIAPAQARATEAPPPPVSTPAPETGNAEPAAPDGPAPGVAQAADSSPGPSTDLPAPVEQDARTDQSSDAIDDFPGIETAAPEPAALLASRTEIPVLLPEDSPLVAEEIPPIRGDAQRAAAAVLAGGKLVREIQPSYPRSALRRDISGSVEVELKIDTRGRVADVSILSEAPAEAGFGAAARRAAINWRFEPFTIDGEPAVQRKTVVFDFDPGDGCRMVTGTRLPSC